MRASVMLRRGGAVGINRSNGQRRPAEQGGPTGGAHTRAGPSPIRSRTRPVAARPGPPTQRHYSSLLYAVHSQLAVVVPPRQHRAQLAGHGRAGRRSGARRPDFVPQLLREGVGRVWGVVLGWMRFTGMRAPLAAMASSRCQDLPSDRQVELGPSHHRTPLMRSRRTGGCMVRGAWCMVHDAWCVVRCAWCMVHGASMVHGAWCMVHGAWCIDRAWCMVHPWCMVHGVWCMVHRE
jgi:hypothetical protein